MTDNPAVETFWQAFLVSGAMNLPPDARYFEAFQFGSSPESIDELTALVLSGVKTATSSLLWEWQGEGRRPPQPGDLSIVLDSAGNPVAVVETLEAPIRPFNAADERFAHDYGEGERTLAWWSENLWESFAEQCAERGWAPSPEMLVVMEWFRVVYRG